MRTLAIDLGSRRVGLALSDEGGKFATPLDVLTVGSADDALEPVGRIIAKEGVQQVVIGLPLNMDDSVGGAARNSIEWAKRLGDRIGNQISIVFVDERLSSFDAEQRLAERKRGGERITRGQKKQMLDALAAAGFLQELLDGRLPPLTDIELQ